MKERAELIVAGARQLVTVDPAGAHCSAEDLEAQRVGVVEDGAVAVGDGRLLAVGKTEEIRDRYDAAEIIDASDAVVTPGWVDPHTHVVFGGSRHREFALRMSGAAYHEILAAGGGIHSTVSATREATPEELLESARARIGVALSFGVTTMEAKSGYGLDLETELKMLRVVRHLNDEGPVRMVPTFLGAHVVPKEYKDARDDYVACVVEEMIPAVAKERLAVACDVFLDKGAFERDEAETILRAARAAGMAPKIHAGQFTEQHGPELVAELGGLSADHMEIVSDAGLAAMASAGVVANLLPGAAFSLRDHFPDGRRMVDAGVTVAVATDNNPGTSRSENLPLMASMAVTRMGLTCAEAMEAITINAARALGLEGEVGSLYPGKSADLGIYAVPDFRALFYHFGVNHLKGVVAAGRSVLDRP